MIMKLEEALEDNNDVRYRVDVYKTVLDDILEELECSGSIDYQDAKIWIFRLRKLLDK